MIEIQLTIRVEGTAGGVRVTVSEPVLHPDEPPVVVVGRAVQKGSDPEEDPTDEPLGR